jgi:nicotinamidase-related amidase
MKNMKTMPIMKTAILAVTLATSTIPEAEAQPQALLDFAGARWAPAHLTNSVLLIVDAQREYTDGKLPLEGVQGAIQEIAGLLARAREAGTPVLHIVHHGKPGSALFNPDGPMSAIVPALQPKPGETVIIKHLPNSFAGTTLEAELVRLGRKNLIVVGFATHMCVSATTKAALDRGYHCTVVAAACATRPIPDGLGGTVAAAELHRAALAALNDRFAVIVAHQSDLLAR